MIIANVDSLCSNLAETKSFYWQKVFIVADAPIFIFFYMGCLF